MIQLMHQELLFSLKDGDGCQDCRLLFCHFNNHNVKTFLAPPCPSFLPYLLALAYVLENTFINSVSSMLPACGQGVRYSDWSGLGNMPTSGDGQLFLKSMDYK